MRHSPLPFSPSCHPAAGRRLIPQHHRPLAHAPAGLDQRIIPRVGSSCDSRRQHVGPCREGDHQHIRSPSCAEQAVHFQAERINSPAVRPHGDLALTLSERRRPHSAPGRAAQAVPEGSRCHRENVVLPRRAHGRRSPSTTWWCSRTPMLFLGMPSAARKWGMARAPI